VISESLDELDVDWGPGGPGVKPGIYRIYHHPRRFNAPDREQLFRTELASPDVWSANSK